MSQSTITPKIHESLYVHGHGAPQITLHLIIAIDDAANAEDLVIRQLENSTAIGNACLLAYESGATGPYAINIS
jgi:hypothetical protein